MKGGNSDDGVMQYYLLVCKIANKYAYKCMVDANDLVQDAYIEIIKNEERINKADNNRAYAGKIASSAMWRAVERRNKDIPLSNMLDSETFDILVDEEQYSEPVSYLCDMLKDLPSYSRFMMQLDGLKQKDIGNIEGVSVQAVNTGIALFRKRAAQAIIESYKENEISIPSNFINSNVLKRKVTYDDLYSSKFKKPRPRRKKYKD
jgi:RNA polymerase sigma factor (sigma-70 family)